MNDPVLRSMCGEDDPFIYNSWLKSFRNTRESKSIPNRIYFAYYHGIIESLLARSHIDILCDESKPGFIYGWACYELAAGAPVAVLHYVYTKGTYRKLGLARKILAPVLEFNGIVYTFRTDESTALAEKTGANCEWQPVEEWLK